jgi:hypothetical protein
MEEIRAMRFDSYLNPSLKALHNITWRIAPRKRD